MNQLLSIYKFVTRRRRSEEDDDRTWQTESRRSGPGSAGRRERPRAAHRTVSVLQHGPGPPRTCCKLETSHKPYPPFHYPYPNLVREMPTP
eukprot:764165-Hanusia_phi.AAC.1